MNRPLARPLLVVAAVLLLALAAPGWSSQFGSRPGGDKPGGRVVAPLPNPTYPEAVVFAEGFDDITTLPGAGWSQQNLSSPLGLTNWFQGNDTVFPAHAGAATAYIGANFNNTSGVGTISNWLLTPVLDYAVVGRCSFWTRSPTGSIWADRLELRYSTAGTSTNVGATATSVGDFTNNPLTINPTLISNGYPQAWTQYTVDFPTSGTGRLAFRYFVTNGGPSGANSNYIGIDTLACEDRAATLVAAGSSIASESCAAANGALDPGETVSVNLCLQNTGSADTVNLVGTLQATGGVENPGAPGIWGVVAAGGPPECLTFSFNVDLGLACGATVTATLALQDGATVYPPLTYTFVTGSGGGATQTFTNAAAITIPTSGTATPYPSAIAVAGMSGTISDVNVTLNGFSHTYPDDVGLLVVSPAGTAYLFVDAPNGGTDAVNLNLTLDDAAATQLPVSTALASGTFRPMAEYTDTLSAPAPPVTGRAAPVGAATLASMFNGQAPNGTWNLYVQDFVGGDGGSISAGWSLTITTAGTPVCCTGACVVTPQVAGVTSSNDPGQCGAVVGYPPPTITGICGMVPCTPASGSFFPVGATLVTCDPEAPGANATMTITVNDTQPPTIVTPSPVAPNDPGLCSAVVAIAPTPGDNCPGVTAACVPPSGSTFPVGVTPISCTATDPSGNTATAPGSVTVNDVEAPTISCPADVVLDLPPGSPGQNVDYDAPGVADNCSAIYDCQPPSGDYFPAGQTPVGCTATDPANNTAQCTFNVILGAVTVLEVPTVSTLGLLALGLLLAAAAFVVLRRHG